MLTRLGVAVGAMLAALSWAVPVHAHADYVSTAPEAGSRLEASPAEVSVMFDSGLLDVGAALVVTALDGNVVSVDPPTVGPRTLSVGLQPDLAPGEYRAAFRVVSEDGHTVTDDFSFTVLPRASDAAAASAVATPEASSPAASSPAASSPEASSPEASSPAASSPAAGTAASAVPAADQAASDGPPIGLIVSAAVLVLVALAAVLLVSRRRD